MWVSPDCKFSTILSRAGIQDRDKWQLAKKTQAPSSTPFSINLKIFFTIINISNNNYLVYFFNSWYWGIDLELDKLPLKKIRLSVLLFFKHWCTSKPMLGGSFTSKSALPNHLHQDRTDLFCIFFYFGKNTIKPWEIVVLLKWRKNVETVLYNTKNEYLLVLYFTDAIILKFQIWEMSLTWKVSEIKHCRVLT